MFDAFDNADRFRMPAMILADGMLGQMMEPVVFPDRSQAAPVEKPWATNGHGNQRKHNITNSLFLKPQELEDRVRERFARYEIVKKELPEAEEYLTDDAELVIAAYGASARVCKSAINAARAKGLKVGLVRPITLWPFPEKVFQKVAKTAQKFLCVEMSMGQMIDDVKLSIDCSKPVEFYGRTGGIIPSPAEVLAQIESLLEN